MRNPLVLSLLRDLAELLRRLPPATAAKTRADAVAALRANAHAAGPDADAATKRLMAAVAGLRATTARRPGERRGAMRGGGVYVVRGGAVVEAAGGGGAARAVGAGKMTPDEAYRKHRQLMKRQWFGREPPGRWGAGVF